MDKHPPVFGANELRELEKLSRVIGVEVPTHFISYSESFLAELMKWNRKMNLVSRGDEQRVIERHLLDSLCLLSVEPNLAGKRLIDVGSGAGFPGVVLAAWEPNARVFLVESRSKRVAFLKAVRRLLAMDNLVVVHSRAERLSESGTISRPIDIVVARGVAGVLSLAMALGHMVTSGGLFVLYKELQSLTSSEMAGREASLESLGLS
jgi:16S rRNA (guanine527-N7)-methyltransferase